MNTESAMLRQRLSDAYKESMKAKDSNGVRTLRLILAALKDRDIAARPSGNTDGIDEATILSLLQSMIKQRNDSIEMYVQGDRNELAEIERQEITIIEQFLPQQLSDEEINEAVGSAIAKLEASSIKDMGKVMGALKGQYAGQMDFGKAGKVVKDRLCA
jgi:hypothetical protein